MGGCASAVILAPDPLPPIPGEGESVDREFSSGSKVLVAEGNPAVSAEVCEYVRSAGLDPVPANDGAEALELYRAHKQDIKYILMNLHMAGSPEVDGYRATCTIMAEDESHPPVVGVSPEASPWLQRRCRDMGFSHVMRSPITAGQVCALSEQYS